MGVKPASQNGKPTTAQHAGSKTELGVGVAAVETGVILPPLHADRESLRPPDAGDNLLPLDEVEVQCPRAEGGTCARRGDVPDPGSIDRD